MIENITLENILTTATDIVTVCEIYQSSATPPFDPADAIGCFASSEDVTFMGVPYKQLITRFGSSTRNTTGEIPTSGVTFSNTTREIAKFEFDHGFEGLILVTRILSRSRSTALAFSKIEFVGRCEKPEEGDKESIGVSAKAITGSIEVMVPRRRFGPDDLEGRPATDPEFEGFIDMPSFGTVTWLRKEKKGGFLGWWNKKWVRHTLNYSSRSALDANKVVPLVMGRAQMIGVLIGGADVGTEIRMRVAFAEGEIAGFENVRSTDYSFPVSMEGTPQLGKVGALNVDDAPTWIGPGLHSRTAVMRAKASGTLVENDDPPPEVAAVVKGLILNVPDSGNLWTGTKVWSDNAAAQVRMLYTDPDYFNLETAWVDDDEFAEFFRYNGELIFNSEVSDFTFVVEG
jgi:hypothetical protein